MGLPGNHDKVVRNLVPYPRLPLDVTADDSVGHAIWIGNLPPQTNLMSLVHHVSRLGPGLESLFLISKSNCAFANYKDEKTCAEAQKKIHDSRFQSVRLVSRLRKSTVEGATGLSAPTGPAASSESPTPREANSEPVSTNTAQRPAAPSSENSPKQPAEPQNMAQKDRFFILKSLTVEDLELSVKTGIWATQSHNEASLNSAYAVSAMFLPRRIAVLRGI